MLFFELNRQLDIRMFQTMSAIDATYGSCAKYVFDNDCLILLGTDHSIRLDISTKKITKDTPIRNWDVENEAMLWFAEDSVEAAIVRLVNDAFRIWEQIDANITEEYFVNELNNMNGVLATYNLKVFIDKNGMSMFKESSPISFEQAIELIMDIDENRMDETGIDNLINEAFFYRNMDRYEDAAFKLEKVIRYVNYSQPIYTYVMFSLAQTYYYMGNYDRAVMLYYLVNMDYIQDVNDYYRHLGHALLDAKMKKYDRNLRIYFHSLVDPQYADSHRQAVVVSKSAVAEVFAEYDATCIDMGRKKYEEYRKSLPEEADDIDELLAFYENPEEKPDMSHKQLEGIKLIPPLHSSDYSGKSETDMLAAALDLFLSGEYQKAFEIYYRLKEQTDESSDYYTWVYFQLGKLYCFFDEAQKASQCLEKCDPNRFGLVYRQEDFLLLCRHVKIVCDDFESDSRYRTLIRGHLDPYFAQYDREYNLIQRDKKLIKSFKQYEKECIEDSVFELKYILRDRPASKEGFLSKLFGKSRR